jgi:glycosyltransferase involved in cell wall biosynthesis
MRATIVGPAYPLRGGIAHHVYWLQQQLKARGHSVQVISFRRLYPSLLFPGKTETDTSQLKFDAGATPVLTALDPRTWARASRLVRAFGPDVVLFQWWQPFFGLLVGHLAKSLSKAGLKCVAECHNVYPHERTSIDRLLLKHAFSRINFFITHSAADRSQLESIVSGRKIWGSPLPTFTEFSSGIRGTRDGHTILFFGKVRKYKGLDVLLKAMPQVLSRVKCNLVIVGEFYDPVDNYRQLVTELGIADRVQIQDRYVANEEITSIFDLADVLVLPYTSASQSAVAQIGLSTGLPIIASDTGGLSEVVTENVTGFLFPPGDSAALADRLVTFFDKKLGPVFGKNIADKSNRSQCRLIDILEEVASLRE